MGVSSLSSVDLQSLRAVNHALLDPLSHDTTEAWLLHVCGQFKTLCHGEAAMAGFSFRGKDAKWISRDLPQKYLDRVAELAGPAPGSLKSADPAVEALVGEPRSRRAGVATSADLLDRGGLRLEEVHESPMFRDVAIPLGLPGSVFLFHSGASGEFAVHASYPELNRRPFGASTEEILATLLPGFAASIGALARLGDARAAVAALLDALEDGAVVFDPAGRRVLARNRAMSLMALTEQERLSLERAILEAADAAAWPIADRRKTKTRVAEALSRAWRSPAGIPYRLRAVRVPAGTLCPCEAILVLVQRVGPALPGLPELMQAFHFTKREAEVAQRLAYGHSNRRIASDLGLSPHTVRHHTEAIFIKVGVTSRKALALNLGSALQVR
jgi:DNA-binding CsgD family transcriptional regulator